MKKNLLIVIFLCVCLGMMFAADGSANRQKIYPVNSEVYEAITFLFINQGYALPSTTGPWSADELIRMLDKIDRSKLATGAARTYDFAAKELGANNRYVRFGLDVAIEGYYHTNTTDFVKEEDWIRGFDERRPLLDIILETWPAKHFYGYTSLSLGNNAYNGWSATEGATSTFFGQNALTTNIILVPPAVLNDFDFNIPFRAFGSAGGDNWSIQIGRDKMSWGPGVTGNFVVGDHLLYHNMGRFTTYGDTFKYTFATSFFPHPSNYYDSAATNYPYIVNSSQHAVDHGLNLFIAHRLEWRMLSDKLGIVLTEAIMYQSKDNTLDLRVLNPSMIFHNYYIRSNANSIISLEADYTPISHVNIYGQIVIDEFALPGEPVPGDPRWSSALPNGYGFMLGAKGSYPLQNGMFFGSIEWAKTDPYLYLRDAGRAGEDYSGGPDYKHALGDYGINYVVALRHFSNDASITYTEEFLGYQYGGDAIVLNANAGYKVFRKWSLQGNVFYMLHGTHDKWTLWSWVDSDPAGTTPNVEAPTNKHYNQNNRDPNAQNRNAVSETLVIGLKGGYTIIPKLNVYAQADYISIKNPGNIESIDPISDVQVTVGLTYSL